MKLSSFTKSLRRFSRALRLREKRFRGDHDYCTRVARCPDSFRVTPYPHIIDEFMHVFVEPLYWQLDENDQVVGPFAADGSPR
jgi:hypothetical protein